jgi:hypothetical protein
MKNYLFLGGFVVFVGVVLMVVGFMEQGVAAKASKVPEEITLKNLIARGPDGNPNILLTDFQLCENYVYKTKNGIWQSAWVPAVPRDGLGQGGRPNVIQALIFTINARDPNSLYQLCGQPKLRALVINKIVSLGGEEKRLLEQSYPGTDFGRCLIIQEGREPAGPVKLLLMVGGGSVVALAGIGLVGFGIVKWRQEQSPRRRPRGSRYEEDEDEDEEDEERPRRRRARREDEDEPRPRRRRPYREEDDH